MVGGYLNWLLVALGAAGFDPFDSRCPAPLLSTLLVVCGGGAPSRQGALTRVGWVRSAAAHRMEPMTEAEVKDLHKWVRTVDQQEVSHIGEEEAIACWKTASRAAAMSLKDFKCNEDMVHCVAALRHQILSFTGAAKRVPRPACVAPTVWYRLVPCRPAALPPGH